MPRRRPPTPIWRTPGGTEHTAAPGEWPTEVKLTTKYKHPRVPGFYTRWGNYNQWQKLRDGDPRVDKDFHRFFLYSPGDEEEQRTAIRHPLTKDSDLRALMQHPDPIVRARIFSALGAPYSDPTVYKQAPADLVSMGLRDPSFRVAAIAARSNGFDPNIHIPIMLNEVPQTYNPSEDPQGVNVPSVNNPQHKTDRNYLIRYFLSHSRDNVNKMPPSMAPLFAENSDPVVRAMAVGIPGQTEEVYNKLAQDPDEAVRTRVAEYPGTPESALATLINDKKQGVKTAAALNDNLPARFHDMLANSRNKEVRAKAARMTENPDILRKLSNDRTKEVRSAVWRNDKTPADAFSNVLTKGDAEEKATALSNRDDLPESVVGQLMDDANTTVKRQAFAHKNAPVEKLRAYLSDLGHFTEDPNWYRYSKLAISALNNPKLTPEDYDKVFAEISPLRQHIIENHGNKLSPRVLNDMFSDPNSDPDTKRNIWSHASSSLAPEHVAAVLADPLNNLFNGDKDNFSYNTDDFVNGLTNANLNEEQIDHILKNRVLPVEDGEHSWDYYENQIKKEVGKMRAFTNPDRMHRDEVHVQFGTNKARKLRDMIDSMTQPDANGQMPMGAPQAAPGGKIPREVQPKALGPLGQNVPKEWRNPKNGNISGDMIQAWIDAQPKTRYNISHSIWKGAQRHSRMPSKVFQVNFTSDHLNKLREAGVLDTFKKLHRRFATYSHPVTPTTLGWVRYTGNPKGGFFIDEMQSDIGQNAMRAALDEAGERGGETFDKDHLDKISKILWNGKHTSEVLGESFINYLRNKGHGNVPVTIHSVETKAPISLGSQTDKPPGHFFVSYRDFPQKTMAWEPASYGSMPTHEQDSSYQEVKPGSQIWGGKIRKSEDDVWFNGDPSAQEVLGQDPKATIDRYLANTDPAERRWAYNEYWNYFTPEQKERAFEKETDRFAQAHLAQHAPESVIRTWFPGLLDGRYDPFGHSMDSGLRTAYRYAIRSPGLSGNTLHNLYKANIEHAGLDTAFRNIVGMLLTNPSTPESVFDDVMNNALPNERLYGSNLRGLFSNPNSPYKNEALRAYERRYNKGEGAHEPYKQYGWDAGSMPADVRRQFWIDEELARHAGAFLQTKNAKGLSKEDFQRLWTKYSPLREDLIRSPGLTKEFAQDLVKDKASTEKNWDTIVANGVYSPLKAIDSEFWKKAIENAPRGHLTEDFLNDVFNHPSMKGDAGQSIMKDIATSPDVGMDTLTGLLRFPNMPVELLYTLANHPEVAVRRRVAQHSKVTPDLARKLVQDPDAIVADSILYNGQKLDPETVRAAYSHHSQTVRNSAVSHVDAPDDVRIAALRDPNYDVRYAAFGSAHGMRKYTFPALTDAAIAMASKPGAGPEDKEPIRQIARNVQDDSVTPDEAEKIWNVDDFRTRYLSALNEKLKISPEKVFDWISKQTPQSSGIQFAPDLEVEKNRIYKNLAQRDDSLEHPDILRGILHKANRSVLNFMAEREDLPPELHSEMGDILMARSKEDAVGRDPVQRYAGNYKSKHDDLIKIIRSNDAGLRNAKLTALGNENLDSNKAYDAVMENPEDHATINEFAEINADKLPLEKAQALIRVLEPITFGGTDDDGNPTVEPAYGKTITKLKGAIAKHDPDLGHTESVQVRFNTNKARKLRDAVLATGKSSVPPKALGPLGQNLPKEYRDPKNGNVDANAIQRWIDSQPATKYNVSHSVWKGVQRHNAEHSKVFQVSISTDHRNKLKEAGVDNLFDTLNAQSRRYHPMTPTSLGWIRYTGTPETGIHIDEIQSDMRTDPEDYYLDRMLHGVAPADRAAREAAVRQSYRQQNNYKEGDWQKMADIVFGKTADHPHEVLFDAFKQYLRDRGHHDTQIHIHAADTKHKVYKLSNLDAKQPLPAHFRVTYDKLPKKFGYEPSQYGAIPTQDAEDMKGKATWAGKVRKNETESWE